MLCQKCGIELRDDSVCPACGAKRSRPVSGCLDPETLFDILAIVNAVPEGGAEALEKGGAVPVIADDGMPKDPDTAPVDMGIAETKRPKPRKAPMEIDMRVPVLAARKNGKAKRGKLREYLALGVIVIALMASAAAILSPVSSAGEVPRTEFGE